MPERLSTLNVVLLLATISSLLFGAWSFAMNSTDDDGNNIPSPSNEHESDGELDEHTHSDNEPHLPNGSKNLRSDNAHKSTFSGNDSTIRRENSSLTPSLTSAEASSNPSDSGEAVLIGRVLKANGLAAANAIVSAHRSDLKLEPPKLDGGNINLYRGKVSEFLARAQKESRVTTTDEKGDFRFSGLDGSLSYNLTARIEGAGSGSVKRVAASDSVTILLGAAQSLNGKVETESGEAISEFTVRIFRSNQSWDVRFESFSSADGSFSMQAPWDTLTVEIKTKGYSQGKSVEVTLSSSAEATVFVLAEAAYLTGVVTDKVGNPLPNVRISVGRQGGNRNRPWMNRRGNNRGGGEGTTTDSLGRYKLDTLAAKETSITAKIGEFSDTKKTTLQVGENQLDFSLDIGASVSIRSTNPSGEAVQIDRIWFQGNGDWPRPSRMPVKEVGLAEFVGIKPGEYTVHLTASGFASMKKVIKIAAGANEFSFQVVDGGYIKGTATDSTSGEPLSSVTIRLRKEGDSGMSGWATGKTGRTQADGSFSLGPVEPGLWTLEVSTNRNPVYSATVTIAAGENTHDVSVDTGAVLEVSLVDEQGNKVTWGRVRVRGKKNFSGNSDENGIAKVSFMPAGEYTVSATANGKASVVSTTFLSTGTTKLTLQLKTPNAGRITQVVANSQAAKAGIQVGDLLLEYGEVKINRWRDINAAKRAVKQGEEAAMIIERNGQTLTFMIKGGTIGIDGEDAVR